MRPSVSERITRSALWLALGASLLLSLPSATLGLLFDDYMQHDALTGRAQVVVSPDDLFDFARGGEVLRHAVDRGPYPWWTHPDLHMAFWRPLSGALIHFDRWAFGDRPALFHLHSIAWHLVLIAVAAALLRRSLTPGAAALALFVFALDDTHWLPVSWVAARNSLVTATFIFAGLHQHLRWREDGVKRARFVSWALFALGLLAGESAIAALGYLVAYEQVGRRDAWLQRASAVAPAAVLVLLYLARHRLGDYGARYSDTYVDPLATPLAYLAQVGPRGLALIGTQVLAMPAELWTLAAQLRGLMLVAGALAVVLLAGVLRSAWPALDDGERRSLRWLALGSVLSLLPGLAVTPTSRVLLVPGLGASAVLAVAMGHLARRSGVWPKALLGLFTVSTLVLGTLLWPGQTLFFSGAQAKSEQAAFSPELDGLELTGKTVYVVAAPDYIVGSYSFLMRAYAGRPIPAAWRPLSFAPAAHRLTRTAADALELEVLGGNFITDDFSRLFRDSGHSLTAPSTVALSGAVITVLADDGRAPTKVRLQLDRDLDDASLVFLTFRDGHFHRWRPGPVGETVELARQPTLFE